MIFWGEYVASELICRIRVECGPAVRASTLPIASGVGRSWGARGEICLPSSRRLASRCRSAVRRDPAPPLPAGASLRRTAVMMRSYRQTLLKASRALSADGDLNMRLTHVACILILLGNDDVPPHALEAFEQVRDPLIAKPLFIKGEMVPRDFDAMKGRVVARGLNDLVLAELGRL